MCGWTLLRHYCSVSLRCYLVIFFFSVSLTKLSLNIGHFKFIGLDQPKFQPLKTGLVNAIWKVTKNAQNSAIFNSYTTKADKPCNNTRNPCLYGHWLIVVSASRRTSVYCKSNTKKYSTLILSQKLNYFKMYYYRGSLQCNMIVVLIIY